ncbi:FG-GAP-like repeat-containing protein [Fulvivirgaceae bacterium BMA10]|uniref:FG-GAP-like repeat-containing protein n=1 Tax=Splendidivirga corallicola TaxID=3051826 RepID=A0ABT8KJI4_9BACT|nr:FG-GAP-like repeat-containing protein [Fulvivirgaceae bacterium BMA10]
MKKLFFLFLIFQTINHNAISQLQKPVWSTVFDGLGTFSSPRTADLNGDGTLDIILGAGREEFNACDSSVIALNGANGELLWNVSARDQIFGSADFLDITGDGIVDIFIGGRSAEFMSINGKTGEIIWEYFPEGDTVASRKHGLYNFYNPQFIPDQDGDQVKDILISNGGDVTAEPYDPNRPTGHLMVISGASGKLIVSADMPDKREIYMSVVVDDINNNDTLDIIYGTGGETVGGNLFRTTLDQLMKGDLSNSILMATGENKGFISPPVLVDVTKDGVKDVIVNAVDGRMMAFSGVDNQIIWGGKIPNTEVYSSLAVGDINKDGTPDFFAVYALGIWPDLKSTRPFLVDGSKGEILFMDSIGFYQTSSPIIADFNSDGNNDVLINVNFFLPNEKGEKTIHNSLLVYDFVNQGKFAIVEPYVGSNVASTPWVGDLDGDGLLDIIYTNMTRPDRVYTYDGLRISRLKTNIPVGKGVDWGAYMGNNYNGIFEQE